MLVAKPPSGPDWAHEVKHDGFRLLARKEGERVTFGRGCRALRRQRQSVVHLAASGGEKRREWRCGDVEDTRFRRFSAFIKGKGAIHMARVYGERKRNFVGQDFWARGFFVNTVGRDEQAIRAYISNQEKEDQRLTS